MGYRKRGPKPKPLVVQVTRAPGPAPPRSLPRAVPGEPLAARFIMPRRLRRARAPRNAPGTPSAELSGFPSPPSLPSSPLWAAQQSRRARARLALAGCSRARQQRSRSAPVPRQLIEGGFSSFHCFINLEQCTASELEWAGAAC